MWYQLSYLKGSSSTDLYTCPEIGRPFYMNEAERHLKNTWQQLAFFYTGDKKVIDHCWDELIDHYTRPERHYHNLYHIKKLIDLIEKNKSSIFNDHALLFAAFYHDVIYDVTRRDNEVLSAALAEKRLNELQVEQGVIKWVVKAILQTASHEKSHVFDLDLFLDFDRYILSSACGEYKNYTEQIRQEYSIFSDKIYATARANLLRKYLSSPEIYYTNLMKGRENAARNNLSRELSALEKTGIN